MRGLTLAIWLGVQSMATTAVAQPAAPGTAQSAGAGAVQAAAPGKGFMSFQEIWKVIEDSPRSYTVREGASGTYTNELWPVGEEPQPGFVVVKGSKGQRTIKALRPLPKAAQAHLDAAEEAYKAQRFEEAAKGYTAVLKVRPDYYPVQLTLGDALLFDGKAAEALARYEKAAKQAPWHYAPWFFQASALLRLGRAEEAADRYAKALSLRPSWPSLLGALESNGRHIGRKIRPPLLKPTARAYLSGDGIVVEADAESPAWMSHAICKAMWLGEPELRKKRTGKAAHTFTMLEERECLVVLLDAHHGLRDKHPDPELDQVMEIAKGGYLNELILYELISRVGPMTIPTLDEKLLTRLHEYVSRYVLVPERRTSTSALPE